MTRFTDGPAAGVVLGLRRSPLFIRVVLDRYAEKPIWDALDQLHDQPKPSEDLWVYKLVKCEGIACVRMAKGGGCFPIAEYVYVPEQPPVEVLKNMEKWRAWAAAQANAANAPQK